MSMTSHGIHARGMAEGFKAGRKHIREINADRARIKFLDQLRKDGTNAGIILSETECDFVERILTEHTGTVPDIHSGDRNICDSLRRKYQAQLNPNGKRS